MGLAVPDVGVSAQRGFDVDKMAAGFGGSGVG